MTPLPHARPLLRLHGPTPPASSPVRRCACGNAIGDGDYASGYRQCAICRRIPRQRRYR